MTRRETAHASIFIVVFSLAVCEKWIPNPRIEFHPANMTPVEIFQA
jgi:hypothetical protein